MFLFLIFFSNWWDKPGRIKIKNNHNYIFFLFIFILSERIWIVGAAVHADKCRTSDKQNTDFC